MRKPGDPTKSVISSDYEIIEAEGEGREEVFARAPYDWRRALLDVQHDDSFEPYETGRTARRRTLRPTNEWRY